MQYSKLFFEDRIAVLSIKDCKNINLKFIKTKLHMFIEIFVFNDFYVVKMQSIVSVEYCTKVKKKCWCNFVMNTVEWCAFTKYTVAVFKLIWNNSSN